MSSQPILILLSCVLASSICQAQDVLAPERIDRFNLFTYCFPLSLVIERFDSNHASAGVTKDAVRIAVESRLRSARIYDAESDLFLYVNLGVINNAYSIEVSLMKLLEDPASGITNYGQTWRSGSFGTFGDADFLISGLSGLVDEFLVEYLRVNEPYCGP